MKLLFENWRGYLVEAKGKDFLSNPLTLTLFPLTPNLPELITFTIA